MKYKLKKDLKKGDIINFDLGDLTEEIKDGKPKEGQAYCYIDAEGFKDWDCWASSYIDKRRWEIGNVYILEEDCDNAIDKQKLITELKRRADFEPDWKDISQKKWFFTYNHQREMWERCFNNFFDHPRVIHFRTGKEVELIIKEYGDKLNILIT